MNRLVSKKEAGKSCPYCRFPLKLGSEAVQCDSCGALHHEDCWQDGRGCAVVGCSNEVKNASASAPTSTLSRSARPADEAQISSPPPRPPASPHSSQAPTSKQSLGRGLIGGLLVALSLIVLVMGGFLLLSRDGSDQPAPEPAPSATQVQIDELRERLQRIREERAAGQQATGLPPGQTDGGRSLSFVAFSDPNGGWTADVPAPPRWSAPVPVGNLNGPGDPPLIETTLEGSAGAFLLINATPTIDPTTDSGNYTIDDQYREPTPVPSSMPGAEAIRFSFTSGELCASVYCTKVLMGDGYGGGFAAVAGANSQASADRIAFRFASTVTRR